MCERVWRIAQVCAKKQRLAAGFREWLAAASHQIDAHMPSMPEAEASHQLFTKWQKFQAGQAVYSQLELATQPSREVKPPNMTFHIPSHPTIYIPLYPRFKESFQREFWERNPRENKIDSSTIFTQETLQIPLLSSSPLSNPWEVLYQNLFSPYPFLWEGHLVLWEAVRKEPISHWLMLWPSSGIWEAIKEIGSA